MFDPSQKSTGTAYTTPGAFLLVAFVFSPAVLVVSHPFGYLALWLAIACSALCVTLAWVSWNRHSQLSMPSIAIQGRKTK